MKICNNCNGENHVEVIKCIHCQMTNDFRPKGEDLLENAHQSDEQDQQCMNCGHSKPGDGPKCMHCHFPLPNGEKPVHANPKIFVFKSEEDRSPQTVFSKKTS